MAEKHIRNGHPGNGAQGGYGENRTESHDGGMRPRDGAPDCPANRSIDRVLRFYSDPQYQVPDWQPRD